LSSLFNAAPPTFQKSLLWRCAEGGGEIWGRRITPDEALLDYLGSHGLDRITGRLANTGIIDVVTTAAVGVRDLMALGKIRQIADRREADLVVVDGPAAGHAISFLRTPFGLARASLGGPVHSQAIAALRFLSDETRCRVQLVCVPEVTPVTECIDTAYVLEDEVGVALAPVVVNQVVQPLKGLISALRSSDLPESSREVVDSRIRRSRIQTTQLSRLAEGLPLEQIHLPQLLTAALTADHIHQLADAYV
jgi:anion-transporting  ArsA/GET3 family ATPase